MTDINLLAKSIEIASLQKTVVQLSNDLATVTVENGTLRTAYNKLHETTTQQMDELSKANVKLVLEKNEIAEARGRQQSTINDVNDDLTGLRHQLERQTIIADHIFKEIKDGSSLVMLPNHESLGKVKKSDLKLDTQGQTLSGMVTYIDDLYKKLDNPELVRLLRV